jgi:hypothetical protein
MPFLCFFKDSVSSYCKIEWNSFLGEAIEKMLQEKKISSKINYDVLKSLNVDGSNSLNPTQAEPQKLPEPEIILPPPKR